MLRITLTGLLTLLLSACGGELSDNYPANQTGGGGGGSGGGSGPTYPACEPGSAPTLFPNALCICKDLADVGALLVKNGPTQDPATLGVNGKMKVINHSGIEGSLLAHGGLEALANVDVQDDFVSSSNVEFTGRLKVGQDLMVGGNLRGLGMLEVGGTLGVSGSQSLLGGKAVGTMGSFVAPSGPPCACGAGQVLDVMAEVAKAKSKNDNAKAKLPPSPVATIGASKLVLNSGSYYFADKKAIGYTKIVVNGVVKMYIDGDLDVIGHDRFDITNGSTLDLFVSGNLHTVGYMLYGAKHHPAAFRLYIGGDQKVTVQVGAQVFRGSIYAPNTTLVYTGYTKIEGSLLAKTIESVGLLELYFARPTTDGTGMKCTPPGGSPPPPSEPDDPPEPKDLPDIEQM
jgi:hypothetical protein